MKRKLFLLRHSYAESPGNKRDKERELTMEGISAARAMGRKMSEANFNPHQILCSTALRAESTAINLTEELGINEQVIIFEEKLYEASVREMLEIINSTEGSKKSILLIGHNPTISFFSEYLTATTIGDMEPCGMVTIQFEDLEWEEVTQGTGTFVSYNHPNS